LPKSYPYLFFLALIAVIPLQAQTSLQHQKEIKSLGLDAEGKVFLTDVDVQSYQVSNAELIRYDDSMTINTTIDDYQIWNGQLRKNLGGSYNLFTLPFTPTSLTQLDDNLLLSSDQGLWHWKDGAAKKFFVPGVSFPEHLAKVSANKNLIALLSDDHKLYLYDGDQQLLEFIDSQVSDFVIDDWSTLWYAEGKQLRLHNDKAVYSSPIIKILSVRDRQDQELATPYILRIRNLDPGHNDLMLRAEGLNDVVGYSNPVKVKVQDLSLGQYWPWVFGSLLLLLALSILSQRRLRAEMSNLESDKEKIKLQLKVADEKQKLGQLQMNPHFIFNTLNSISGLIALSENKKARTSLNRFSSMMRKLLEQSQQDYIPLSAELDFLDSYLSLEQLIRNDKFDYQINVEGDDNYLVPPMILQPFLENAIVHGINPKSDKGFLKLTLTKEDRQVLVVIEDNGIGRAKAALNKREGHESAAIKIIEQRLKNLNKWSKLSLSYEDLVAADGNPSGTKVRLHLPIRKT